MARKNYFFDLSRFAKAVQAGIQAGSRTLRAAHDPSSGTARTEGFPVPAASDIFPVSS